MKADIIPHVFGSLQTLERSVAEFECFITHANTDIADFESKQALHGQFTQVLKNMRRVANKLQLEVASENWPASVRSLKVFYGLHHMIRPDVLAALQSMRNCHTPNEIPIRSDVELPAQFH